jgi:flagellar biosynthesis GTPase FlhF
MFSPNYHAEHSDLPKLASLVDELSQTGKGLVMTMGKGGVGKTTVAAAARSRWPNAVIKST